MSVFKFRKNSYIQIGRIPQKQEENTSAPNVPEGLWIKCPKCGEMLYKDDVRKSAYSCYKCGGYFRIKAKTRIRLVVDEGSFQSDPADFKTTNPLSYPDYEQKIEALQQTYHLDEAVLTGTATIGGEKVVIGAMDSRFLMASMGQVVGEKITRAIETATKERLPVVMFCCSGGARMQEGIFSLMQMAKTSAAIKKHSDAGLLYLPVLTDPTTGGVTASFAMLGDMILAEPGSLIGFAGPRVIQQTIGQKLPEGFQRAEFLLQHGMIDKVVKREELRETLRSILTLHSKETKERISNSPEPPKLAENRKKGRAIDAWDRVVAAREAGRPSALDYIHQMFTGFIEFHGDRLYGEDGAVVGGIADFYGKPVTIIGIQKGKNTKENISRNFGMPSPEGYRKALRLMKQAEKFGRPIITFIDTPGAFCGTEAEERGQGEAIARNLMEMAGISVPIISILIGEGGSGGALALALGNEVWMLENATYSILSPEGFASILWKDSKRAKEAANMMKMTARDLYQMKVVDRVILEDSFKQEEQVTYCSQQMAWELAVCLEKYNQLSAEEIVASRYERFRKF